MLISFKTMRICHKKFFLCNVFVWLLVSNVLFGQSSSPKFIKYDLFNGLPSFEVYQLLQDHEGYIWACTDRGVIRIDGNGTILTLNTAQGLYEDAVYGMHEDSLHRLWFFGHSGRLNYWKNGHVYSPSFNDSLPNILGPQLVQYLTSDKPGRVYIGQSGKSELTVIDTNRQTYLINDSILSHKVLITDRGDKPFLYSINSNLVKNRNRLSIKIRNNGGEHIIKYTIKPPIFSSKNMAIKLSNGGYAIVVYNSLLYITNEYQVSSYKINGLTTVSLYEDKKSNLWVGTEKKGVFCFLKGDLNQSPLHYLKRHSVSSIYQDNENGYWFTTLDAGIFYTPNLDIYTFDRNRDILNAPVISANWDKEQLLVRTSDNTLFKVKQKGRAWEINDKTPIKRVTKNLLDTNKILAFGTTNSFKLDKRVKLINYIVAEGRHNFLYGNNNNRAVIFTNRRRVDWGEGLFNDAVGINIGTNIPSWVKLTSIAVFDSCTYLGSSNGLYKVKLNGETRLVDSTNKQLKVRINDICKVRKNLMFLATIGKGILLIENDKLKQSIKKKTGGLPSNLCNKLQIQGDSILWVGTNKGLCKITLDENLYPISYRNITTRDGLTSNYILSIDINESNVAVGTDQGFCIWNNKTLNKPKAKITTKIARVLVNNQKRALTKKLNLSYKENSITLNYTCNQYQNAGHHLYRYKLSDNNNWVYTYNTSVNFHSLSPGNYTFEVQVQNSNATWTSLPDKIEMNISPPFWDTVWARIGAILVVILLVGIIGAWFVSKERVRYVEQMELARFKSLALRNQMNPHFIFNSLASIQKYILENNVKDSVRYLAKFARLMRITLENSRNTLITVGEELRALKMYVEMEKTRSKEGFEYKIILSQKPELKRYKLPPFLLQPFVENAILHGLMPKEGKRKLEINIDANDNDLICVIEDNGVGRDGDTTLKKQSSSYHQSRALEIIANRIRLIEKLSKTLINITINDLYDNNKPSGTKVVITIPLKLSKNDI